MLQYEVAYSGGNELCHILSITHSSETTYQYQVSFKPYWYILLLQYNLL